MVSARRIENKKKKDQIILKKYNIWHCYVELVRTNAKGIYFRNFQMNFDINTVFIMEYIL